MSTQSARLSAIFTHAMIDGIDGYYVILLLLFESYDALLKHPGGSVYISKELLQRLDSVN